MKSNSSKIKGCIIAIVSMFAIMPTIVDARTELTLAKPWIGITTLNGTPMDVVVDHVNHMVSWRCERTKGVCYQVTGNKLIIFDRIEIPEGPGTTWFGPIEYLP